MPLTQPGTLLHALPDEHSMEHAGPLLSKVSLPRSKLIVLFQFVTKGRKGTEADHVSAFLLYQELGSSP